jgi:hypothetical protein
MSANLRRFLEPKTVTRPGERCEMCGASIDDEHAHVVNVETRSIQCACRACYLLFTNPGAGGGKRRAVPSRFRHDPAFALSRQVWESAGIPVSMAFVFVNSTSDTAVAFYPSPAGATESMLSPEVWREVLNANPDFADIAADVEALLIVAEDERFEAFLVPIDVCYELVGLVRTHWKGFDGGDEARRHIDAFYDRLRSRSDLVEASHG